VRAAALGFYEAVRRIVAAFHVASLGSFSQDIIKDEVYNRWQGIDEIRQGIG